MMEPVKSIPPPSAPSNKPLLGPEEIAKLRAKPGVWHQLKCTSSRKSAYAPIRRYRNRWPCIEIVHRKIGDGLWGVYVRSTVGR